MGITESIIDEYLEFFIGLAEYLEFLEEKNRVLKNFFNRGAENDNKEY